MDRQPTRRQEAIAIALASLGWTGGVMFALTSVVVPDQGWRTASIVVFGLGLVTAFVVGRGLPRRTAAKILAASVLIGAALAVAVLIGVIIVGASRGLNF